MKGEKEMSIKIYNGYRFDRNYTIRELDEKLIELRKQIQLAAEKIFTKQILDEWLYIYDCYTFFGEETALKRMKKYEKEPQNLNWDHVLHEVTFYIEDKIRKSKSSTKRDFEYDYQCEIHILPITRKLLFLYYGEKEEFLKIVENQKYVMEYHYQNQTDKPENISASSWKTRKNDWDKAIIDYIPNNHGFTVSLVSPDNFPIISSSFLKNINPEIANIEKRAKALAYDIDYPCEKMTISVLCSKEYKDFIKKNTDEISKKLKQFNNWEDIIKFIYKK